MPQNPTKSALIVIDMENAFLDPSSPCCIAGALETVGRCERAVRLAREKGIPVFFVKRIYRANGSDVELTRYRTWQRGERMMAHGSTGAHGATVPAGLRPQEGDYTIIKPRWSAFFMTELDLILRRLGVRTVILTGTTTPNCVRTTAYDANALDYQVVVLEDCTSSQTPQIQKVNIEDMRRMGAVILTCEEFSGYDETTLPSPQEQLCAEIEGCPRPPEAYADTPQGRALCDLW